MSFEGMFPLPDYDGGPADRVRDMAKARKSSHQDWVETEHRVIIEQDLIGQYSNEITLDDLIKAGIIALRAQNRIKFVEAECTDGGY